MAQTAASTPCQHAGGIRLRRRVTLVIFGIQHWLVPVVQLVPFILLFLAVFLAAWVGGRGPGFVAIGLGAVLADYHFLQAHDGWSTSRGRCS